MPETDASERNRVMIERFYIETWNRWYLADEIVSENVRFHGSPGSTLEGPQTLQRGRCVKPPKVGAARLAISPSVELGCPSPRRKVGAGRSRPSTPRIPPAATRPPWQRSRAPDCYPNEHVAHEQEQYD